MAFGSVTVTGADDPYTKIFKALDNPEESKRQLQTLSDQHKVVLTSLDELAEKRRDVQLREQALAESKAELEHSRLAVEANHDSYARIKTDVDNREEALNVREKMLLDREIAVKAHEDDVKDREAHFSTREASIQAAQDSVEQRYQEAEKARRDVDVKLGKLKDIGVTLR